MTFRRLTVIVALLMVALVAIPSFASAQGDPWTSAYGRNYEAGPNAEPGTLLVQTIGFTFTEDAPLDTQFMDFADGFISGYFQDATAVPTGDDVADLGDEAVIYEGTNDFSGDALETTVYIWRDGNAVFVVSAIGDDAAANRDVADTFVDYIDGKLNGASPSASPDASPVDDNGVKALLGETEGTPAAGGAIDLESEVTLDETGDSTGGVFQVFPTADDELAGFLPSSDVDYSS